MERTIRVATGRAVLFCSLVASLGCQDRRETPSLSQPASPSGSAAPSEIRWPPVDAVAAPGPGPGPTPAPAFDSNKVHRVGETVKAPDFSMTVESVKECKVAHYFRPRKGNVKLGVLASIEGSADKDVPVSPFYAKIKDADGRSFGSTFGGCEPELKIARITKGEAARGWITFEIPESASNLKLVYDPFIIGPVKQEVKVDLGR